MDAGFGELMSSVENGCQVQTVGDRCRVDARCREWMTGTVSGCQVQRVDDRYRERVAG